MYFTQRTGNQGILPSDNREYTRFVLRLSLIFLRWKIKSRSYLAKLFGLRVSHEPLKRLLAWEILSSVSLFGIGMALLEYHRFIATIGFFGASCIVLGISLLMKAFTARRWLKWASVITILLVISFVQIYLMSGVNYFFSLTTIISPYQRQLLLDC